ncbi:MAG: phage tail protein [Tumebacillaceae bacterium]
MVMGLNIGNIRFQVGTSFRFQVELDSLIIAQFSEVSGLQSEIEYEEYNEGGNNHFTHRFPKRTKTSPLVLKRGVSLNTAPLWAWYQAMAYGTPKVLNGAIVLVDERENPIGRWVFVEGYPSKYSGPDLNAMRSEVAIETLEIVYKELWFYPS